MLITFQILKVEKKNKKQKFNIINIQICSFVFSMPSRISAILENVFPTPGFLKYPLMFSFKTFDYTIFTFKYLIHL